MACVHVVCRNCGTAMDLVDPPPAILCIACGAQMILARAYPAEPAQQGVEDSLDALGSVVQSGVRQPGDQRKLRKSRSKGPLAIVLIGCAVLVGVFGALIYAAIRKNVPPGDVAVVQASNAGDYARLAAVKSSAEELALHGRLAEAHAVYGKLLADPAAADTTDDHMHELVASARSDQSRIYQILISQAPVAQPAEAQPTTSAVEAETQPAPVSVTNVSLPDQSKGEIPQPLRGVPLTRDSRPTFPAPRRGLPAVTPSNSAGLPTAASKPGDLDARIGESMQRAVDFVLSNFHDGELKPGIGTGSVQRAGLHALCVYALLQAGQSLPDERLNIHGKIIPPMIETMKSHSLDAISRGEATPGAPVTYSRSLRAAALAVFDRPQDRKVLQADVKWLIAAQSNGEYTYDDRNAKSLPAVLDLPWDNSNSQYGLLGVWAGAEVGVEVSDKYWQAVDHHWKTTQQPNGQWQYSTYSPVASLAMTCGGLASLMVTYDYLDVRTLQGAVGRDPYPGQVGRGLQWLEAGNNAVATPNPNTFYLGYDLYSVERVGLASGLKFFGSHDWYRELAEKAMNYQWPNGAVGSDRIDDNTLIGTSYVLLFLARGRHPVMMEKLRFEGHWDNRPRDLANLARFASHELEQPVNWQTVSVDRPWQDWFDAPVLFIASHQAPKLSVENYANLRGFIEAGGLILTQSDAASDAFNKWVPELVQRIAPGSRLEPLPPTHPIYSVDYRITAPPHLLAASNGSRVLVVHSPVDLSAAWQRRQRVTQRAWFDLGINIFAYAGGKRDLRNRVSSLCVPEPAGEPTHTLRLARLSYAGNWDPEPFAWIRLSKILQNEQGLGLDIRPVAIESLAADSGPLAHLTGTAAHAWTDVERSAIAKYVNAGGALLIDSTGGRPEFIASVKNDLIRKAFPAAQLSALPPEHPLMQSVKPGLRPYALESMSKPPPLQMAKIGGGYVIFSPIDLTSGLLGTNTWGIVGYAPSTSEQICRNLIEWVGKLDRGQPK